MINPELFAAKDHFMRCPACGDTMGDNIGCEKTITCPGCGKEWKYGNGLVDLVLVTKDDPIFYDR